MRKEAADLRGRADPRPDPVRGVRYLATAATAATLLLIAMGGAVRATDSGLACPDWPACYGQWIPPADLHMWLEHSHRLWAGVVGLLIFWLAGWTMLRHRDRPALPVLSVVAAVLVLVQAGLGAAVVLLFLRAGLVTAHLGMSLIVVGCLALVAVLARPTSPTAGGVTDQRIGVWASGVAAVVFVQSLLGGQATGRGAAYVFNAFPIWLAGDAWTGHIRQVLHVTHRFAGYLVAAAVVGFAVAVRRDGRGSGSAWLARLPIVAAALVVVQVGLGLTNVLTRATVASAVGHLAVASWLWTVLVVTAGLALTRPTAGATRPHFEQGPAQRARMVSEEVRT